MSFVYEARRLGAGAGEPVEAVGSLGPFVESIWYARGQIDYPRERIAPTGSTVAGIVLGSPIEQIPDDGAGEPFVAKTGFLIGPHDRPIINAPTAETYCLGIVTTPIGCQAVFGVRPSTIRGRVVDLEAVWPPLTLLRNRLLTSSDSSDQLSAVSKALCEYVNPSIPGLERCAEAVAALEADPTRSIASLAAELGITHGHLDRLFTRVVGVGPRTLARTLRVRRLLDSIDVYGQVAWTSLAAELGWFDQAHLIRDFKRHTGVTPSEYQRAQRGTYSPDEAEPGFVPERSSPG